MMRRVMREPEGSRRSPGDHRDDVSIPSGDTITKLRDQRSFVYSTSCKL